MKAYLKNYRQSPRKVRLVADLVRGKSYEKAMTELSFLPKRASEAIAKLISSAAANAENNFKKNKSDLFVKEIRVDQGITMKRIRPRSRGMAHRINKRTSNVIVTLAVRGEDGKKKTAPVTETKTETKPAQKKTVAKKAATKKTTTKKAAAKKVTKQSTK